MKRYTCICDERFKTKKEADLHIACNEEFGIPGHFIFKKKFIHALFEIVLECPWSKWWRGAGVWIILYVILSHFDIKMTSWEMILIGVGVGMVV